MSFEDQLKKLKKELEKEKKAEFDKTWAKAATAKPTPAKQSAGSVVKVDQRELSDDELFEASLKNIDKSEVYRGKFGDANDRWEPKQRKVEQEKARLDKIEDEAEARQAAHELREQRTFEDMVGKLDSRFTKGKYHVPSAPKVTAADTPLHTEPLALDSEGLREVELTPAHKELLKRAATYAKESRVPELNLRGRSRDDAMARLEGFLEICARRGDKYARVIHGKGKQSADDPVIKPAVLTFCEGPGAKWVQGYAPEAGRDGDYGVLVLEFRKK